LACRIDDPWGNPILRKSTSGYAFTGREWDPETNRYYNRARYYDPKLGRFISEDPIGFAGGANLYRYVRDNPVTWTDPFGLYDPNPPGGFGGGTWAMWKNYRTMVNVNTKGVDKYYHCMANCQAASQGPGGYFAAWMISELREDYGYWKGDPIWDSMEDMRANQCGRKSAPNCSACNQYLPPWFTPPTD
jgi:RHS repeat-associated protein